MKAGTFALIIYGSAATAAALWRQDLCAQRQAAMPASPAPSDQQVAREVALCDVEVPILLHGVDPMEGMRAGLLVERINCGIGKRLP